MDWKGEQRKEVMAGGETMTRTMMAMLAMATAMVMMGVGTPGLLKESVRRVAAKSSDVWCVLETPRLQGAIAITTLPREGGQGQEEYRPFCRLD